MIELGDWSRNARFPDRPWLIFGKGPTFDRRERFDLSAYNTFALNHVVRELPVDVAHIADIDVVESCSESFDRNCRYLVMPLFPHVRSQPCERRLHDYFDQIPVLRRLDGEGRLVWYNLAGNPVEGRSPVVTVRFFSSEAAIQILGHLGTRTIRSLGIDGGRHYGRAFDDLASTTLMANGQETFDLQSQQLRVLVDERGIDYQPLVDPLRIFVGTDESQVVAYRVLEYSIRRSASVPVEVIPTLGLDPPKPTNPAIRPGTAFSFCRFQIPELCGYRGRALYLDADMVVFGDIAELADLDFGPHKVLCTFQPEPPPAWVGHADFHPGRHTAVMLLDCGRLDWKADDIVAGLDDGAYTYDQLMSDVCILDPTEVADTIPVVWNHLEHFDPATKLLHFTVVPTQPWKSDTNPLGELWMSIYREAVEAGAVLPEEVEELVAAGQVRSSLRWALSGAPTRRSVLTNASLDLVEARRRIARLESSIADMRRSWQWRIGEVAVRPVRLARRMVRGQRQ